MTSDYRPDLRLRPLGNWPHTLRLNNDGMQGQPRFLPEWGVAFLHTWAAPPPRASCFP
jgi:hypothetical protein